MTIREVIFILMLIAAPSAWADPCSNALKSPARIYEEQIAQLLVEKHNLTGPTAPALGRVLDADINLKLAALAELTGTPLSPEQRAELVEAAAEKKRSIQEVTAEQQHVLREGENDRLVFSRRYRKKFENQTFSLRLMGSESNPLKDEADSPGVQWTDDERFVLIRSKIATEMVIFDLENQVEVPTQGHLGYLTPGGLWISQSENRSTYVTDLRTGQVWGPFGGIPARRYLNDQFLVTQTHSNSGFFRLYHKETHQHLDVRSSFVADFDWKRIAYERQKGQWVVFDTTLWQEVKRIYAEGPKQFQHNQRGFLRYRKDHIGHLLRLSDLEDFSLGKLDRYQWEWGMDDNRVALRQYDSTYVFMNLKSSELQRFENIESITHGPGQRVFALNHRDEQGQDMTTLFDLDQMKSREVEGEYVRFSPDGKWVYRVDTLSPTEKLIQAQEFAGERQWSVRSSDNYPFHADSEHVFIVDPQTKAVQWIRPGANAAEAITFGQKAFGFSPSGKYLLTFDDDELVILRFKP